jgi:hypothetical protein
MPGENTEEIAFLNQFIFSLEHTFKKAGLIDSESFGILYRRI